MQFQVPQFIDIEDKIVGPLTLKQFLYIAGSVGLSILLFFLVNTWLWLLLSIVLVSAAVAMSVVKINGQPLIKIALSAASFYWRPQTYVWHEEKKKGSGKSGAEGKNSALPSLESLVAGMSLRKSWQNLQTGSKTFTEDRMWHARREHERYEVVRKTTGERTAVRRVDYR